MKKMDLTIGPKKSSPELLSGDPCVLSLGTGVYISTSDRRLCRYSDPKCKELVGVTQQDLDKVKAVIHAVNSVSDFGQPSNRGIDGALAYGFFAELLGVSDNFWAIDNSAAMVDFLSDVFQYRFPPIREVRRRVRPWEEREPRRVIPVPALQLILGSRGTTLGLLSFTERSIEFDYMCSGSLCKFYIGFADYKEIAASNIGRFDWYSACWKHLFFQLLGVCGIRFDPYQFLLTQELPASSFEEYRYKGTGPAPENVINCAQVLRCLNDCLADWKDTAVIYSDGEVQATSKDGSYTDLLSAGYDVLGLFQNGSGGPNGR